MELLQLSYFWVVARLEHMKRAAEELNVTQPSLSRSIARLEREIGVPLFDRHGRGLRLNQLGRVFLGHIDQVARELDSATRQLRDMAGLELGTISLAAGALHWLPEVLRPFIALHPDVQFRLAQRSLPEMTRLLAEAEIDSCFLPGVPLGPRTRWHHLRTAPISLIVPSSHRLAGRTGVGLSEVDGEDMILGKPGDVLRETMTATSGRPASSRASPARQMSPPPSRISSRPDSGWPSSRGSRSRRRGTSSPHRCPSSTPPVY